MPMISSGHLADFVDIAGRKIDTAEDMKAWILRAKYCRKIGYTSQIKHLHVIVQLVEL